MARSTATGSLACALAAARAAGGGQASLPFYQRLLCGGGNVVTFVALVALATRVEFPIDSLPSVAMILLGVLALVAGVVGFCAATGGRGKGGDGDGNGGRTCCCGGGCAAVTFVVLQLIGVALQSLLTLLLFVRLEEGVRMVVGGEKTAEGATAAGDEAAAAAQAAEQSLVAARWVLLCLLLPLQSAGLALAMATTCCGFGGSSNDEATAAADAPDQAAKLTSLAALRGDVERGGGGIGSGLSAAALGMGAVYERTRGALVAKYGKALVGGKAFWRWR
jgi:hypothetical protein